MEKWPGSVIVSLSAPRSRSKSGDTSQKETEPSAGGPWRKLSRADMIVMLALPVVNCRKIPTADIRRSTVDRPTGNAVVSAIWGTTAVSGVPRSAESDPTETLHGLMMERPSGSPQASDVLTRSQSSIRQTSFPQRVDKALIAVRAGRPIPLNRVANLTQRFAR
jgi:hypothetical protein